MVSLAADTKLTEVIKYFMATNLKDLRPFSDMGKKKAELKRSLAQITGKEPFDAYTGLAILSIYENNLNKAIEYFKIAYDSTNHNLNSSMNYAHILFLDEQYEKSISIYLDTLEKYPNNTKILIDAINSLERFYFIEDCEKLINISKGIEDEILNEQIEIVNEAKKQLKQIREIGLDIIFVRQLINAVEKFFLKILLLQQLYQEKAYSI